MTQQKAGIWLFAAASGFSFIAALIPVVKGQGPNGVFLGMGTVFLVIAIASARKARVRRNGPPAGWNSNKAAGRLRRPQLIARRLGLST